MMPDATYLLDMAGSALSLHVLDGSEGELGMNNFASMLSIS